MISRQPSSAGPQGLGLPTKLALGFVVLLAILLPVGIDSIALLTRLGGSIDVILRENYESVVAGEQMKESLERMDSAALFALAGHTPRGGALAGPAPTALRDGPGDRARQHHAAGRGGAARSRSPALRRVRAGPTARPRRRGAGRAAARPVLRHLFPPSSRSRRRPTRSCRLNQRNMVQAHARARRVAAAAAATWPSGFSPAPSSPGSPCSSSRTRSWGRWAADLGRRGEIENGTSTSSCRSPRETSWGSSPPVQLDGGRSARAARERPRPAPARAADPAARHRQPARRRRRASPRSARWSWPTRPASAPAAASQPGRAAPRGKHGEWLLPLLDRVEAGPGSRRRHGRSGGPGPARRLRGANGSSQPHVTRPARWPGARRAVLATGPGRGSERHARSARGDAPRHALLAWNAAGRADRAAHRSPDAASARPPRPGPHLWRCPSLEESRQPAPPRAGRRPLSCVDAAVAGRTPGASTTRRVKLAADVDPETRRASSPTASSAGAGARLPAAGTPARTAPAGGTRHGDRRALARDVSASPSTDTGDGVPAAHPRADLRAALSGAGHAGSLGSVGLGLAVARSLVQAHGGEIHCDSAEGQGSTFWFTLPAALG